MQSLSPIANVSSLLFCQRAFDVLLWPLKRSSFSSSLSPSSSPGGDVKRRQTLCARAAVGLQRFVHHQREGPPLVPPFLDRLDQCCRSGGGGIRRDPGHRHHRPRRRSALHPELLVTEKAYSSMMFIVLRECLFKDDVYCSSSSFEVKCTP